MIAIRSQIKIDSIELYLNSLIINEQQYKWEELQYILIGKKAIHILIGELDYIYDNVDEFMKDYNAFNEYYICRPVIYYVGINEIPVESEDIKRIIKNKHNLCIGRI